MILPWRKWFGRVGGAPPGYRSARPRDEPITAPPFSRQRRVRFAKFRRSETPLHTQGRRAAAWRGKRSASASSPASVTRGSRPGGASRPPMAADRHHRGRLLRGGRAGRRHLRRLRGRRRQDRRGRRAHPHRGAHAHRGPDPTPTPSASRWSPSPRRTARTPRAGRLPARWAYRRPSRLQGRQSYQATIKTNRGTIVLDLLNHQGDMHRQLVHLPGGEELLQQHPLPPAHHRGHLRAAVRRPHRDGQRRSRATSSPTRT